MDKMLAYKVKGVRQLELEEIPIPQIDDGEVLMKVLRWTICRTDVSHYLGELNDTLWDFIPGHEARCEVIESKDKRIPVGTHLVFMGDTDFGIGAEYKKLKCIFPKDKNINVFWTDRQFYDAQGASIVVLPENEFIYESSLLEPLCCVLRALYKYSPQPGDNVVILGSGPIGIIALQCLKNIFRVNDITVLDINKERLKIAQKMGANKIFEIPGEIKDVKQLIEDSRGAHADYLFEALPPLHDGSKERIDTNTNQFFGTQELQEGALDSRFFGAQLLKPEGTYLHFSAEGIPEQTSFWWPILAKGTNIHSAGFDNRIFPMQKTACILEQAYCFLKSGVIDLKSIITSEINFKDEKSVKAAFDNYTLGINGSLKPLIIFD